MSETYTSPTARHRAENDPLDDPLDDIIDVNVGGQNFATTRATLCGVGVEPRSMLSVMFGKDSLPSQADRDGRIFIDRDGSRFRVILNYLRTGTIHVDTATLRNAGVSLHEIREEAQYFGLGNLRAALDEEIKQNDLQETLRDLPSESHCSCCSFRQSSLATHENSPRLSLLSDSRSNEGTPEKKRPSPHTFSCADFPKQEFIAESEAQKVHGEEFSNPQQRSCHTRLQAVEGHPDRDHTSLSLHDAFTLNADF